MKRDTQRIIDLQRQVKIARDTLTKIRFGHSRYPDLDAEEALDKMFPLDRKTPLQGLVGHEKRRN